MVNFKRFAVMILLAGSVSAAQAGQLQKLFTQKTAMNGECAFSLDDPFSGRLEESHSTSVGEQHASYLAHIRKRHYVQDLVVYFGCERQGDFEKICKEMAGVELDGDKWVPASRSDSSRGGQSIYADPVILNLKSNHILGGAYIASDVDGPLQFRQRSLGFCMTNGRAIIWGSSLVDHAPYSATKSTEAEAIRLIRSIKFDRASE